jgi:hypothetical protein
MTNEKDKAKEREEEFKIKKELFSARDWISARVKMSRPHDGVSSDSKQACGIGSLFRSRLKRYCT